MRADSTQQREERTQRRVLRTPPHSFALGQPSLWPNRRSYCRDVCLPYSHNIRIFPHVRVFHCFTLDRPPSIARILCHGLNPDGGGGVILGLSVRLDGRKRTPPKPKNERKRC